MAILIDDLFEVQTRIGQRLFVAKPAVKPLICRLKDLCGVVTGRYEAVKFAELEKVKDPNWKKVTAIVSPLVLEKIKYKAYEDLIKQTFKTQINAEGDWKGGRNKPCPCGSGLKFKKCHGNIKKVEGEDQ